MAAERFPDFEIQEVQELKENSENQNTKKSKSTWPKVRTSWAENKNFARLQSETTRQK